MYFCDDADLLVWEPGVFLEPGYAHQALIRESPGTLTGTGLLTGAVLASILPGMIATVTLADDSLTQLLEVTAVADASHATLSALRGREDEAAIGPLVDGPVKVTVVTFRPQIAAVGDDLLSAIGVTSDRAEDAAPPAEKLAGFRPAAIFGTLAAIYRKLSDATGATAATLAKKTFYESMAKGARRVIAGTVDEDGDGTPETRVRADVPVMERL